MSRRFVMAIAALVVALVAPAGADPGRWTGQWFKVTIAFNRLHVTETRVQSDRRRITAYARIDSWTAADQHFDATFHFFDPARQVWVQRSAHLGYVAGGDLDLFVEGSSSTKFDEIAFSARIQGQDKGGTLRSGTVRSLGGYSWEIDDVPGSNERWIGSVAISGKLVDEAKVPPGAKT